MFNPYPHSLFALDLGTTKFCLAALLHGSNNEPPRIEIVSVDAQGMRRGMLANFEKASQALNSLLENAERQLGVDISRVVTGVAGSHLDGFKATASTYIDEEVISPNILLRLSSQVEQANRRDGKEILHTVPISYRIDNRESTNNPIGFSGKMLHGEFLMIFSDQHYLKDIVNLCNHCGLQVSNLYAEPFASSSVTLADKNKELGAAVADIGGGTTDGIVYQNGRPSGVFTVNVASLMMTNDLAIGLGISQEEAERAKIFFGLIAGEYSQSLEVKTLTGHNRVVYWREVAEILAPRIKELTLHIVKELLPYKGMLAGGILLTGGGANVKGIGGYMSELIKIPVKRVNPVLEIPQQLFQSSDKSNYYENSTKFATSLGLLNLEISRHIEAQRKNKKTWPARYLSQFVNWLKELS
jgi:cell division protein FtsA